MSHLTAATPVLATHEVAQAVTPSARVVYVDHDPVVALHARSLLHGDLRGVTDYVEADLREPGTILAAAGTLDFTRRWRSC